MDELLLSKLLSHTANTTTMDSYTIVTVASPIAAEQVPVNNEGGNGQGTSIQCVIA